MATLLALVAGVDGTASAVSDATHGPAEPNDELFRAQWHLRATGIPRAWEVSTGEGAVVAVLDTGVAFEDHGPYRKAPDLAGTRFVPGYDFVDNDSHPNDVPVKGTGSHGTHVAGTIAQSTNNVIGTAGVAPGAAIMPVRVLAPDGSGTSQAIALGLRFAADHAAHVALLALGATVDAPDVAEAVAYAIAKGVTVVVSSGEDGTSQLTFPAAYPDVLAVGAVRYDNTRAPYSNHGAALDVVAPGGDLEVDQNADGLDDGVVQQTLFGEPAAFSFCYCFKEGTSSAAAHVAGVAALVIAAGRAKTPAQVRDTIVSTAADLGPPGRDDEYGAGLVQATRALGMPPGAGEVPPTTGSARHTHDHDGVSAPEESDAIPPTSEPAFALPTADEDVSTRLRRRWAGAAVIGGLALAGLAGYFTSRRRRRKGDGSQQSS
ncbi:MAG: S8 family serine peptidase [Actinomycetota bacterium]|nr:S8 family serine peptidase [Actinomycetota bacterium]